MRRFLFWSLCFCLLFPVGLSSCDGSDSAAVIFGGTTGKLTWTLTEDGVLTITGEGPMPDYRDGGTSETPPWYPHVNRISSLTIGEGVTRIGDYAFMLCSFVTKVVIPESVTSMGDWAFSKCIFTRHNNGFVRQRHLQNLISCTEYWTIPFCFKLLGEYVDNILYDVKKHLECNMDSYLRFIGENEKFFNRTKNQMISYWNCYYRSRFPNKELYIGFNIFNNLEMAYNNRLNLP